MQHISEVLKKVLEDGPFMEPCDNCGQVGYMSDHGLCSDECFTDTMVKADPDHYDDKGNLRLCGDASCICDQSY